MPDEISSEHRHTVLNVGDPDITSLRYHSPIRIQGARGTDACLCGATGHPLILSPILSSQGGSITMDGSSVQHEFRCLKAGTRRLLIKLKEQVTRNHVRSPSHINIKRSERPYSPLRGTTFGGSRMNPTRPPRMSACIHLQAKKHLT